MKVLFLTISFCLFCLALYAQNNDDPRRTEPGYYKEIDSEVNPKDIRRAGEYLKRYTKQYYLGLTIIGGGYIAAVASVNSDSEELATVAGLAILGGIVVQFISHRHIGKAGDMLERSTLSKRFQIKGSSAGTGLALAYSF